MQRSRDKDFDSIAIVSTITLKEIKAFFLQDIPVHFLEAIVFNEKTWTLITQFEVYLRDDETLKDCVIKNQPYPRPPNPTALVHSETDRGKMSKEQEKKGLPLLLYCEYDYYSSSSIAVTY